MTNKPSPPPAPPAPKPTAMSATAPGTPSPNPSPAPVTSPPTASLSASPATTSGPGQTSILTWSSTNGATADLSNVGPVAVSGTQSVSPSVSTNYTLKVIGADGSSQTANATVTVTGTPAAPPVPDPLYTPPGSVSQLQLDIMSDTVAVKGALSAVAADARKEYEQLSEVARGQFHQFLNDIEIKFGIPMPAAHTLFGAKK